MRLLLNGQLPLIVLKNKAAFTLQETVTQASSRGALQNRPMLDDGLQQRVDLLNFFSCDPVLSVKAFCQRQA